MTMTYCIDFKFQSVESLRNLGIFIIIFIIIAIVLVMMIIIFIIIWLIMWKSVDCVTQFF